MRAAPQHRAGPLGGAAARLAFSGSLSSRLRARRLRAVPRCFIERGVVQGHQLCTAAGSGREGGQGGQGSGRTDAAGKGEALPLGGRHAAPESARAEPQSDGDGSAQPSMSSQQAGGDSSDGGRGASKVAPGAPPGRSAWRRARAWLRLVNPLRLYFGPAWGKAVILSVVFFCSTSIFSMLQNLKDGVVVSAMGAASLPFLQTLGTLPASLAFFSFWRSTMVPAVPPQHLYYWAAAPLLALYALFAFVLYPLAPALHGSPWLARLPGALPEGLQGLAAAAQHPLHSLFFVAADLWGPVMITASFWDLADQVVTLEESAQIYPTLGLLANLGLAGSGRFIKGVYAAVGGSGGGDSMGAVLKVLVLCILAMGAVMMAAKHHINQRLLRIDPNLAAAADHHHHLAHRAHHEQPKQQQQEQPKQQQQQQPQQPQQRQQQAPKRRSGPGSWFEALHVLTSSPSAASLTVCLVAFAVSFRLLEWSFKDQLQRHCADAAAYCLRLADLQSAVGLATTAMMLVSRHLFERLGWATVALASPAAMLLFGGAFFGCSLLSHTAGAAATASPPLFGRLAAGAAELQRRLGGEGALAEMGLGAGFLAALAACAFHNSLFSPSKQLLFKAMPSGEVQEVKSAVDLVGGQVAKSAAGWLVQALLLGCGTIAAAVPAMAAAYLLAMLAWLKATVSLAGRMRQYRRDAAEARRWRSALDHQLAEWRELGGWRLPLPLPRQLAVAAATANPWRRPGRGSGAAAACGRRSRAAEAPSDQDSVLALLLQPPLLRDAGYWERVYEALAGDPDLLEAVVVGVGQGGAPLHELPPGGGPVAGADAERAAALRAAAAMRNDKAALHTVFDAS